MIPHDVIKVVDYMCLIEGKENQQLVWIVILMTVEEVWNMLTCCAGADEGNIYEIGSSHPSIKQKRAWRRKLYSLRINGEMHGDETKVIVEVMLKQVKSWSNGHQCDWMRYPQEIEDNKKNVAETWSKEKGELLQQEIRRDRDQ